MTADNTPTSAASGVVMRIIHATGVITSPDNYARVGQYVATYDPEAFDGYGDLTTTADPAKAHVFPTAADAMQAWRAVPTSRPLRADGQPNRPLTAFTVEILSLEEAAQSIDTAAGVTDATRQ